MTFGIAVLISWLVTAALGGVLVTLWAGRDERSRAQAARGYNRPPPYIPRRLLGAHILLASGGLTVWVVYLLLQVEALTYVTLAALLVVTLLGAGMFVRWLGSRRMRQMARRGSGGGLAESRLPTFVVLWHGVMGLTTVFLFLLSWVRPDGF
jgi:hypothetical protein